VQDLLATTSGAALRLLLLDRPWGETWEHRPEDVPLATQRLEELYVAAGRKTGSTSAVRAVHDALVTDLDVPTALETALAEGGDAARLVIRTLALQ